MYGKRRSSSRRSSSRASTFTRNGPRRTYKKVGRSFVAKPRFATVGFSRSVEKKYLDKALAGFGVDEEVTGASTNEIGNGFMWNSAGWYDYDFATPGTAKFATNDLVKGVNQGTTATTRIGNKISVKFIKGAITLTAAKITFPATGTTAGDMNGESVATAPTATTLWQFLRTTFRVVIVKDLQVNSVDDHIDWDAVFETGSGATGETGGVHSELKIANMGRFRILSDQLVKTDAVCPQETIRFMIPGSSVGQIRYNGPSEASLTDQGIYVIWSAYTSNVVNAPPDLPNNKGVYRPTVTMHSRLCFTDD